MLLNNKMPQRAALGAGTPARMRGPQGMNLRGKLVLMFLLMYLVLLCCNVLTGAVFKLVDDAGEALCLSSVLIGQAFGLKKRQFDLGSFFRKHL